MATSLERLEKRVRSVINDQISTIWRKFGDNRSSKNINIKKLTQAGHIARWAGMPRGLNKWFQNILYYQHVSQRNSVDKNVNGNIN